MTFHNIFSKKEINENKPKSRIIVDHREKNSLVPSELVNIGFNIEFQSLQVGDYLIKNTPIERKTISDLKSSIINKRVFEQIRNLKANQGILLIEGIEAEDIYKGIIHENALRGFFLSLAIESQVPFIFTKNEKDTAKYLSVLEKKKENPETSIRHSRIMPTRKEQLQFILEGFPNIGPAKAKALIKRFRSIKEIVNSDEEALNEILGSRTLEFMQLLD